MIAQYFRLTCLTPVHIGSGDTYSAGVDLYYDEKQKLTYLLDSAKILEALSKEGRLSAVNLAAEKDRLCNNDSPEKYQLAQLVGPKLERNVRAAMRDANSRLFIPGSSLKGALRTLLFTARLGANGPDAPVSNRLLATYESAAKNFNPKRPQFAAQNLEQTLFRSSTKNGLVDQRDAHADLMRLGGLPDAILPEAQNAALLLTAAVATSRITLTAVEALPAGAAAVARLACNPDYPASMFTAELPAFDQLSDWSRRHAKALLDTELAYFRRPLNRDSSKVEQRLSELHQRVAKDTTKSIFLRLGWGSGFRTMTGGRAPIELEKALGHHPGPFGPKTRKVILADSGDASPAIDVFGWIVLTPISESEARAAFPQPILPGPPPTSTLSAPASALPGVDSFIQGLGSLKVSDLGRLQGLYENARRDPQLKPARLAALGAAIARVWKDDKKRLNKFAEKYPDLISFLKP